MNKKIFILPVAVIAIICITITPSLAYNVEELNVVISTDGGATITAGYTLNWGEYLAYSLIGNRERIAEDSVERALNKDVKVNYITSNKASVTIPSFVQIVEMDGYVAYISPKLAYNRINDYSGSVLESYPLLGNFVVDTDSVTPDRTIITFPDGYSVTYLKPYPDGFVPPVIH